MPGTRKESSAAAEGQVRQKRIGSKKHMDSDFVYDVANSQTISPSFMSTENNSNQNIGSANSQDFANMLATLECRIAELELEKVQTSKSRKPEKMSMQDIRDTIGQQADVRQLNLPIFDELPTAGQQVPNFFSEETDGKLKSGYELKTQFKITKEVLWPHAHLGQMQHLCSTNPDELSLEIFMYGYFTILNRQLSETELMGRIEHGKQVAYHAVLHGWPSARRFHYKVLWAMEHENLTWKDKEQMILLSMSATQEVNMAPESRPKKADRSKSIICYFYNNDTSGCKFDKSAEGCKKLHACSLCAEKGFLNSHRAFECKK